MNAAPPGRRGFGAFVVTVVTLLLLGVILRSVGAALASRHHAPTSPAALQASSPPATRAPSPSPSPLSTEVPAIIQRLVGLGYPVRCGGDRKPLVGLTFDDGPGPLSEATITILRSAGARATFFLVGKELSGWPALTDIPSEELTVGTIGDHTWNHVSLVGKPNATLVSEVLATQTAIAQVTGAPVVLFRPPYGAHDAALDSFLEAHGMLEVLWSIDSMDSQGASPDQILARVSSGLRPGAIILLHENRSTTLHALSSILSVIKARGFRPVTIEQLLERDPPSLKQLKTGACP
ncbi:MAG: polysaccharide deacetylase family protein [Actinomycetota bacterium]|nr:polysaccharide deacetylase family protein [Actinomycetota bacterium]